MSTSSKQLSCCFCESADKSIFLKMVDGFELMRCQGCGLIYLGQVLTEAKVFLEDVVSLENDGKLEYWGYPEYFMKHQKVFDHFFTERYQRIKSNASVEGAWLDIGSGFGLWQSFLKERNQQNLGLEIDKKAFDYASRQGGDVYHTSIEKFSSGKKFAAITMCDVLEHVEDPLSVLKKCNELLVPGGLLYLQVPSVLGLKYPYGDSLGLPHHLWQFDSHTLRPLTVKSGFKVVKLWTGVQGVIKYYEKGGPGLLRKTLWNLASWSKLGNRLQLLVRK